MAIRAEASTRAGRYVAQPAGYGAFVPAPLPPQPALALSGERQGLPFTADRALGRLDGSVLTWLVDSRNSNQTGCGMRNRLQC
jgi:hypothetical protein